MIRGNGHEADTAIAKARKALDWDAMYDICLDREKAMEYRARSCTEKEDGCSMCGDICAVKIVNRYLTK